MQRSEVLAAADDLITGDRQKDYGGAEESFGRIATLWSTYLGGRRLIEPHEVAVMMALLKISRAVESPSKADTYVDLAGYGALAAELAQAK